MKLLSALAAWVLSFSHRPPITPNGHEGQAQPEQAVSVPSIVVLIFGDEAKAPTRDTALLAIPGAKSIELDAGPDVWKLESPIGTYTLEPIYWDPPPGESMRPFDRARFTKAELGRLLGSHLTLSLKCDLAGKGMPGFHNQIRTLFKTATDLQLPAPIALYDPSSERWHPPAWVQRMVTSEAGPGPSMAFQIHTVRDLTEEGVPHFWIHSHGVARLAGYEISAVDVEQDQVRNLLSIVQSVASYAAEGNHWPAGQPASLIYGLDIAHLPWQQGLAILQPRYCGTEQDHDEGHRDLSILVIEQNGKWVHPGPRAARLEEVIAAVSNRETERAALAARETYPALRDWHRRTRIPHEVRVKARVETTDKNHEHCWFKANKLDATLIQATLLSTPIADSFLKPGDTTNHKLEHITGWFVRTESDDFGPDELEALLAAEEPAKCE
ncbi:MAG: hypothetical protein R3E96_14820 [Planctomycetota bacterium]